MVYKDGFIACCKVDGKILREDAGVVTLPFGCEYSVLLKNLTSVRAQVKVSVDGTDATEGTWLIVPANGELELERYIRNGNFDRGNRFKFIERTGQIEENKGIGAADGLIRVEYKSEVVDVVRTTVVDHIEHVYHHRPYWYPYWPYGDPFYRGTGPWISGQGTITCNSLTAQTESLNSLCDSQSVGSSNTQTVNTANMGVAQNSASSKGGSSSRSSVSGSSARLGGVQANLVRSAVMNDVGITVPGSESGQKFTAGPWFKTEATSHVIVLQLRGMVAGKAVKTAVTVKTKAKCGTCGTVNRSNMKFCGNCGASLTII